jgi:hypothetical protein
MSFLPILSFLAEFLGLPSQLLRKFDENGVTKIGTLIGEF